MENHVWELWERSEKPIKDTMETMYIFCKGVVFVSYMFGVEGL